MEDVGEEYFRILRSMSFFQPSVSVRDCRSFFIMHDCVHDLATFVLGDFGFRLEENNNLHNLPSMTRHLSIMMGMIHNEQQFDGISNATCLRTFLRLRDYTYDKWLLTPQELAIEKGCLRVLSLRYSRIVVLLDSIGNLKHLRYLDVSFTVIKEIPDTICTLYNLETLLLKECRKLTRLPTDIGNLKHLRYLDISSTFIKEIPDSIFTLYNLETLLLMQCIKLTRLPTDIGCLIKLRHLDFSGSSIKELPLHIFNMKDLHTIQPSFILGKEHADSTIKDLGCLQNLHGELSISGLENVVDVKNVCEAKLRDKKFITELHLSWDGDSNESRVEREVLDPQEFGLLWDRFSDDFMEGREILDPKELGLLWDGDSDDSMEGREILDQLQPHTNLKKLFINRYPGTRFSDWMGDQSFSSIVQVELFRCENCRSLWPLDQLPALKTLLIVDSFKRVETIINWEFFSNSCSMTKPFRSLESLYLKGMFEWKEWLFSEGEVVFPALKELQLIECPKLEVRLLPDCFPSLTRLEVKCCRQVMLIPATHQGLIVPSLQVLEISGCPEQEWSFVEGEVVFPTLKELVLNVCPKLEVPLSPDCFPSLTRLQVTGCRQVMLIPTTHQGLIFPSLQELVIRRCPEQELILEGGLPSSLERITISRCHNLKALDNNGFRLLTSLRKLEIEYCDELQCLPELPSYPFDLVIYDCPFLESRCQENGEDWLKIKHARLKFI